MTHERSGGTLRMLSRINTPPVARAAVKRTAPHSAPNAGPL